ncbi:hypothetical protein GCM10009551_042970 [Nocardiopsis tropica]
MWERDTTAAMPASSSTAATVIRRDQREDSIPINHSGDRGTFAGTETTLRSSVRDTRRPVALHSRDRLPTQPYDLGEHSSAQIATALNHLGTAEVTGSPVPSPSPTPGGSRT